MKNGVVVIDASVNRILKDGRRSVVGDACEDLHERVALITPVPGGVGPVTVTKLFQNTVHACMKLINTAN